MVASLHALPAARDWPSTGRTHGCLRSSEGSGHPILARSRSARRTRAGKARLSGRNARIPLILLQVDYQRLLERAMAAAAVTAGRGQVADCR